MSDPTAVTTSALRAEWETYYFLIGTAAAALMGLAFVMIAFISQMGARLNDHMLGTYGTPTVVHFGTVLLVSALLCAPWPALPLIVGVVGIIGAVGAMYGLIVFRRLTRRQTNYVPVLEDWLWHVLLPLLAHGSLIAAAIVVRRWPPMALVLVAGASLMLLFAGVHNAWDTITYVAAEQSAGRLGAARVEGETQRSASESLPRTSPQMSAPPGPAEGVRVAG